MDSAASNGWYMVLGDGLMVLDGREGNGVGVNVLFN